MQQEHLGAPVWAGTSSCGAVLSCCKAPADDSPFPCRVGPRYHQASVFHYKGRRLTTYRSMGDAVLGPRGGLAVEVMQFFINLGAVITNTILA